MERLGHCCSFLLLAASCSVSSPGSQLNVHTLIHSILVANKPYPCMALLGNNCVFYGLDYKRNLNELENED